MTTLPAAHSTDAPNHDSAPLNLAALVGAIGWARLPAAVRRRFEAGHPAASYPGEMSIRCSPVGRVFAALARAFGGPLAAINADGLAAQVSVHGDGHGGVVWARDFGGGQGVRSTKALGSHGGLIERTDGGLGMVLDVFESHGSLIFQSRRFFLQCGRWQLPIPSLLTPGTCRVTHTDLGGGRFRFTLAMTHPLWGRTFHQTGVFTDPA